MNETFFIIAAALLPVVIALYIIYKNDEKNPEPTGQLMKALLFGVLSAPLSGLISGPLGALGFFSEDSTTVVGRFAFAFFGAAVPEECMKLIMLWLVVRNNRYFDEHFDGIVYAVCIGMGFAGLENVIYLFNNYENWMGVGIARALMAIPGHFFFAILMGYFYSLAHFTSDEAKRRRYMMLMIGAPVVAHGLYDALLMVQQVLPGAAGMLTMGVVFLLNKLRKVSKGHIEKLLEKDGIIK